MKKYKKILIDAILFFVIIGLTLYGVFHGEDLSGLKDAIKECSGVAANTDIWEKDALFNLVNAS